MSIHNTINYVEFLAEDLSSVKDFYVNTFGWEFTDYGPEYIGFKDGSNTDGAEQGGFGKGTPSKGGSLVILYSDNLEESEKIVKENGGVIVKEIFSFPGGRRFHFTDPAGNELAVWSEK